MTMTSGPVDGGEMATTTTTTTPAAKRRTRAERAAFARRAVAFHEAGHAVVALVVKGRRFRYVTIKPDEGGRGHCMFTAWPRTMEPGTASLERLEPFLRKAILVMLAGGAAEAQFRGRRSYVGAEDDYASARTYAKWATASRDEQDEWGARDAWHEECARCEWGSTRGRCACDAYFNPLWMRAEELVEREMPAITALAEALLERETIRYTEARDLVNTAQQRAVRSVDPKAVEAKVVG
jgi:ATP-dependent Zn protease